MTLSIDDGYNRALSGLEEKCSVVDVDGCRSNSKRLRAGRHPSQSGLDEGWVIVGEIDSRQLSRQLSRQPSRSVLDDVHVVSFVDEAFTPTENDNDGQNISAVDIVSDSPSPIVDHFWYSRFSQEVAKPGDQAHATDDLLVDHDYDLSLIHI